MRIRDRLLRSLWLALCLSPLAQASQISICTSATPAFSNNLLQIELNLENQGDEAAFHLQVEAEFAGEVAQTTEKGVLETGERWKTSVTFTNQTSSPGQHTALLRVRYQDANGYDSTALSWASVIHGDAAPETRTLELDTFDTRLQGSAQVSVKVSSLCGTPLNTSIRLITPPEIDCRPALQKTRLAAGQQTNVLFALSNRSALKGSVYTLLAVADAVHDGRHDSVVSAASLSVSENPVADSSRLRWSLALCLLLWGGFVFIQTRFAQPLWNSPHTPPRAPSLLRRILNAFVALPWGPVIDGLVLFALVTFVLWQLQPRLLFIDTMTVGGDTPAHSYLASHLKNQLFHHGRVISWAGGWWCGFPMFQYYFCLPYLLIALLDLILPFNVAFKLVTVLGILALPLAAFAAGRIMRLPRPVPVLLAIAMVPFLFVGTHTMWGVSVYSTLAGMLANSLSFPIMLIALARLYSDSTDGRFRLGTTAWIIALLASHFFTSITAGIVSCCIPMLLPRKQVWAAVKVIVQSWMLAGLCMAWWIVPLLVKQEYSVDFGENWRVLVHETIPTFALWLLPLAFLCLVVGLRRRSRPTALTGILFLVALVLFLYGFSLSPVFVNVRLWPFLFFAIVALEAGGAGMLLIGRRAQGMAVLGILIAALTLGIDTPNYATDWARWNYSGLESKPRWPVFRDLVFPLRGSPGRLANDLHDDNNQIGSSRIFESVPHLIGKPVLEGGLVNSGLGSMFAYYIQSETSRNCAGFPPIVKPTRFNFSNATKHLELFNVKHFIARSTQTQRALQRTPGWKLLRTSGPWQLHELTTHAGDYVYIPRQISGAVVTRHWKEMALQWMYTPEALDDPFAILHNGDPKDPAFSQVLNDAQFLSQLSTLKGRIGSTPPRLSGFDEYKVEVLENKDGIFRFRTNALGKPHIIKYSYFPNWKVKGADRVYMVTPGFMLVFPTSQEVELYYGSTISDLAGRWISAMALCAVILHRWTRHRQRPPSTPKRTEAA